MTERPTTMPAEAAGRALEVTLDPRAPVTAADAAAKSGLALRDAAAGLHWLTDRYRGHLRVTEDGDLIFVFPTGFTRPWVVRDGVDRALSAVGRGLVGALRFVFRAWLLIVMVAYALAFVAVLIALTASRSEGSNRRGGDGGALTYFLFRALADALFWTVHPWSPVTAAQTLSSRREEGDETPFYAKVDRFVFGPPEAAPEPREMERRLVAQIRAGKGRIGLADVMRVTGLPRREADPLMARLMVDYDGDVSVSEEGGISYRFEALRKSATATPARPPRPAWDDPVAVAPLTGNSGGANALIVAINAFNAVMAFVAIQAGVTVSNLLLMLRGVPFAKLPFDGTAVALGVVPLVFSLAVLLMPLGRALLRPWREARAARERARRSMVRIVVDETSRDASVPESALASAWRAKTGRDPTAAELRDVVLDLGGDVESRDDGQVRYRFADLSAEARAVAEARDEATDDEARAAPVVFTSER